MTTVTNEIPRGDRWLAPITVTIPNDSTFDWTGIQGKCEFRDADNLALVQTVLLTPDLNTPGAAIFKPELTGEQTIALDVGERLAADVVIWRTSPVFGPHTLMRFNLSIIRRITVTT